MRTPKILLSSVFAVLALAGTASAQITITNVFNAASRVVNGSLARGALIAVQGRGVGTSEAQQATYPLPTTGGLGGVTIQIASGGQFFDGIMVYTKPNEVGTILPSAVPVGPATLTVNNNGATASKNINVIDAAFGIFTQRYGIAAGLALAFNPNDDGSVSPNTTTLSCAATSNRRRSRGSGKSCVRGGSSALRRHSRAGRKRQPADARTV